MAGLGYKLFASGEVLTAANLQGYAVDQSTMVFATTAARTTALAAPSEGMVSYLADTNSVEIYDGANWKRVVNTTGSILQVVYGSTTTTANNNTSTYSDTGLTATITPSSTSSKILVLVSHPSVLKSAANANNSLNIQLLRGATQIGLTQTLAYTGTALENRVSATLNVLDSPATTSATIYKTQFKNDINAAGVSLVSSVTNTITLLEVAA